MKLGLIFSAVGIALLIAGAVCVANAPYPISLLDAYQRMLYGDFYPMGQSMVGLSIPCLVFGYLRVITALLEKREQQESSK